MLRAIMGDVHNNGDMECVNKIDIHLQEPLPLLCCISVTNKAPEDTNAALEDPYVFRKLVCVQFQCSSQEAFHFFGSLLNCGAALPQMHVQKTC